MAGTSVFEFVLVQRPNQPLTSLSCPYGRRPIVEYVRLDDCAAVYPEAAHISGIILDNRPAALDAYMMR